MMHSRSTQLSYRDRTDEFRAAVESLKKHLSFTTTTTDAPSGSATASRFDGSRSVVSIQSEFQQEGLENWAWDPSNITEAHQTRQIGKEDINFRRSHCRDTGINSSYQEGYYCFKFWSFRSSTPLQFSKIKEVLTMRTENLKAHDNRRQLFSSSASKDATNPFIRQRPLASRGSFDSTTPAPWANDSDSSPLFRRKKKNGDSSSSTQPVVQQQQQQQLAVQDSYMQSRAVALQNVESTIHELGNIFTQLATMVSQQGELAIRIDENMDDTLTNVEGAQGLCSSILAAYPRIGG
uniref:t-SNARE coiled-coil homology domain-containing protein n=1 Tax=Ananas comosus var. bracteatus TaxID=296719 RepID=A0A6V7QQS9_ANACO